MQKSARLPHIVRGVIAAGFATFTALFAHVVGGAEVPGWLGVVVPLIFSIFVCTVLAGRSLPFVRLALSVVASQALFHGLFMLGTPSAETQAQRDPGLGHHHHGAEVMPVPLVTEQAASHNHAGMWLAHLAGTLVTILFLHQGERTLRRLWLLARRLTHRAWCVLSVPRVLPISFASARIRPREVRQLSPISHIPISSLRWRGPPVVSH